jgi:erythromycin esterase
MRRGLLLLALLLGTLPLAARVRAVRSGSPAETPAAWLRARALDDAGFARLTKNAQVVALGDATHGTHETYAAKQHLVPLLVENGFRTIAFEAPYAEWRKLDDYVLHGIGDPAAALQFRLYWFWDANEILDLVRWARARNEAGLTPPIRITGVDSTEPVSAAQLVVELLRRVDPEAAAAAEESYACVSLVALGQQWCDVDHVRAAIAANRDAYARLTSPAEADELVHAARVVEQGLRVIATWHGARDEIMAENIQRLASRGDKVIVLGHNEHWGRTPYRLAKPDLVTSAGTLLAASLGTAYFSVGSVLLDGTFLAIDYEERYGQIRTQIMTAPSADDVAVLLDRAGLESMMVPLHGVLPSWLAGTRRMRIGTSGVPSRTKTTLDVPVDLGKKFDAVVYFRRSTPTQLRHWPVF